jgi:hypothetical protein
MRLQLLAFLLLVGCSSGGSPELPKQPDAPTDGGIVASVGKDIDKVDGRVAAAVQVAKENANDPVIVKAETGVALSYLPPPQPGDLAFARQRATQKDAKAYAEAEAYGKKLLARIEGEWAKLEAQQKEAKRVSDLKDARLVELAKEIDRVRKEAADEIVKVRKEAAANLWTMAGVAVAVLGAVATAFASPKVGVSLLACGAAIGAFPFVIESEYFTWIAGGFLLVCAALGVWVVWDKARDEVNQSDKPEEPK